jgi:adenylate cyclase
MSATSSEAQWPVFRRAARTVVVVDLVESVRLIEQNEEDTVRRWQAFVGEVVTKLLPPHGGRLVKSLGDGLMVEFEAVPPAIQCAIAMQAAIAASNAGRPNEQWMCLRVGAHVADVIFDERDIYGAGVNLVARLTTLAGPGEIVVSADVRDRLVPGLDAEVEDLGECHVKHLAHTVRAYRVGPVGERPVIADVQSIASQVPTIAVIPLTVRAPQGNDGFVGDIIADDIIAALSTASHWRVISRLSTAAFRDGGFAPADLHQHLQATYVLSGACHIVGSKVRISVELADVRTQTVVWADTIAGRVEDLTDPSGELTASIVQQVGAAIFSHELRRSRAKPMPTVESYTLLFASIALMHRLSYRDFERSRSMLEHLIERHPHAPAPKIWMAKWHVMKAAQGWSHDPAEEGRLAHVWAQRGLEAHPDHAAGLAIDGLICSYLLRDLDAAGERFEAAIASNPNESLAWLFSSARHAYEDRGDEALACAQKALGLSPLDPLRYFYLSFAANASLAAGNYAGAISFARESARANCTHSPTFRSMAIAQVLSGDVEAARESVRRLVAIEPSFSLQGFRARYAGARAKHAQTYFDALATAGAPEA